MSIHVTVNGNSVNVRRGRMVLSDLDQIKKNERDRRRRLRLEQVRQQSKEISNRVLERTKNIAKDELTRLEKNDKSPLKQLQNRKIMEIQQKYQEDMADIGLAHTCAALEPDPNVAIEEERRLNRAAALKRGKEAAQQMKEVQQKDTPEQQHLERLRQVRELENLRSSMIAKLSKNAPPEKQTICDADCSQQESAKKRKNKKVSSKKSPGRVTKSYLKVIRSDHKTRSPLESKANGSRTLPKTVCLETPQESAVNPEPEPETAGKITRKKEENEVTSKPEDNEGTPRKTIPVLNIPQTKADKIARYNPEDYTQETSRSSSDTSSSVSDDSSYFSDSGEQSKCVKTLRSQDLQTRSKVQLYDHGTRQRNTYNKPLGVVEKIDARNERSAIDLAREVEEAESVDAQLVENRRSSAQRRGADAILREKVRRDYRALVQNLDQLAREERKLKASQIKSFTEDVCMREQQRNMLKEQQKKRLNHALKTMINQSCSDQCSSYPTERVVTLAPRESDNISSNTPDAVWKDPSCTDNRAAEGRDREATEKITEKSREEQILDMLQKVERQKRLLLQEFGADLPNNIFNASMRPLFEAEKLPAQETSTQRPVSPEIRVINMSEYEENAKKSTSKGTSKSTVKKVEIAVQTTATDAAHDKSVQVELGQKEPAVSNSTSSDVDTSVIKHPLEPKVTIITPEVDTSDSTISVVTGVTIDIDDQKVQVTPQKKKSNLKISKRPPSRMSQKPRSTPASKTSSPVKRYSKSLPVSRQSSPKKTSYSMPDTPSKKIDIYINKSGFNVKVQPSQSRKVAVDATTQSSQIFSVDSQAQSTGKPYRLQAQTKRLIKIKDTSDTSTSFASPPPIKPGSLLRGFNNVTPILELLNSTNETIRMLKRDVSPVSTPETPSPRTMMIPSNVPHPDRINRMLRYASTDSQTNGSPLLSSTKNDQSTSVDLSDNQQNSHVSLEYPVASSTPPTSSQQACPCKNPGCKLLHRNFDEIHDYAVKNCPEILQKYEDLQNMCTERIASLTDLIEKVRSEQKGMEFSVISQGDETSLMQLPTFKPMGNDLQSVQKLVESIEAIHSQLARTLLESHRIIKNEVIAEEEAYQSKGTETEAVLNDDKFKQVTEYGEQKLKVQDAKAKPKIISEQKVNIQLDRFKMQHRPQTLMTMTTPERNSWPPHKPHADNVIEALSKEILEESKGLSKSGNSPVTRKKTNDSSTKRASTNINDQKNISPPVKKKEKETSSTNEANEDNNFVPFLSGIPKVPRGGMTAAPVNGRGKPPVTLLSGPFRPGIESPGHELSTIVELDTPDTANKSQNNVKTPPSVKKNLNGQSVKSSVTVKPSVHVAPLRGLHNEHLKPGKSYDGSSTKRGNFAGTPIQNEDKERRDPALETSQKRLQRDMTNQGPSLRAEVAHPRSVASTDLNDEPKNNNDKNSSSSNSFSGLSGISEIMSTPSSDLLKCVSSSEEMEITLKKLGLGWAVTTLQKTRQASALSSSSNSDATPVNTARRMKSPAKKQFDNNTLGLPDFSDVSSISIKEASKSTEQAVLLKGRTSTPKLRNSNSNSARMNSSSTNSSGNFQEPSDSLIIPNVSLTKIKSSQGQLESL